MATKAHYTRVNPTRNIEKTTSKRKVSAANFFTRHHCSELKNDGTERNIKGIQLIYNTFDQIDGVFFDSFFPDKILSVNRTNSPDSALLKLVHTNIFSELSRGNFLHHYIDSLGSHGMKFKNILRETKETYSYDVILDAAFIAHADYGAVRAIETTKLTLHGVDGYFVHSGIGLSQRTWKSPDQFNIDMKFSFCITAGDISSAVEVVMRNGTHAKYELKIDMHFTKSNSAFYRVNSASDIQQTMMHNVDAITMAGVTSEILRPGVFDVDLPFLNEYEYFKRSSPKNGTIGIADCAYATLVLYKNSIIKGDGPYIATKADLYKAASSCMI